MRDSLRVIALRAIRTARSVGEDVSLKSEAGTLYRSVRLVARVIDLPACQSCMHFQACHTIFDDFDFFPIRTQQILTDIFDSQIEVAFNLLYDFRFQSSFQLRKVAFCCRCFVVLFHHEFRRVTP